MYRLKYHAKRNSTKNASSWLFPCYNVLKYWNILRDRAWLNKNSLLPHNFLIIPETRLKAQPTTNSPFLFLFKSMKMYHLSHTFVHISTYSVFHRTFFFHVTLWKKRLIVRYHLMFSHGRVLDKLVNSLSTCSVFRYSRFIRSFTRNLVSPIKFLEVILYWFRPWPSTEFASREFFYICSDHEEAWHVTFSKILFFQNFHKFYNKFDHFAGNKLFMIQFISCCLLNLYVR